MAKFNEIEKSRTLENPGNFGLGLIHEVMSHLAPAARNEIQETLTDKADAIKVCMATMFQKDGGRGWALDATTPYDT